MIKRTLITIIISIGAQAICDTPRERQAVMDAYRGAHKRALGRGGFGSVNEWFYRGLTYAVKEVEVRPSSKLATQIENGPQELRDGVRSFREMMDSFPFFEELFDEATVKEYLSSSDAGGRASKLAFKYFREMKGHALMIDEEIRTLKLLSEAALNGKPSMDLKFHFCVRESGLKFLIFQQKYGPDLGTSESKKHIASLSLSQRFKLYLAILSKMKFLHSQGIVHCDIKPANILWTSAGREDLVIVDYGLAQRGRICLGGTNGYRAPEVVSGAETFNPATDSYKADVYAFGAMLVELEISQQHPAFAFVPWQAALTESSKLAAQHPALLLRLAAFVDEMSKSAQRKYQFIASNYEGFYESLKRALADLLNADVDKRADLNTAYKHIWRLYQLSLGLGSLPTWFSQFAVRVENFLESYPSKGDYFSLPIQRIDFLRKQPII